ncbi:hypothetical protein DICVIV_04229, partial [Dictyocaulus viviparus]
TSKSITPLKQRKKSPIVKKRKKSITQQKASKKKTLKSGKSSTSTNTKHSTTSSTGDEQKKKEKKQSRGLFSRNFRKKSKSKSQSQTSSKRAAASGTGSVKNKSAPPTPKSTDSIFKNKGIKKIKKQKKTKVKSKSKTATPTVSSAATSKNTSSQQTTPSKQLEQTKPSEQKKPKAIIEEKKSPPKILPTQPSVQKEPRKETITLAQPNDDNAKRIDLIKPVMLPEKLGTDPKKEQKSKNTTNVFASKPDEVETNMVCCSNWSLSAASRISPNRIIIIMRSAERVDRVFGKDWILTEAPHGILTPTDLNIPSNFTTTQLLNTGVLLDNSPITIIVVYLFVSVNYGTLCYLLDTFETLRCELDYTVLVARAIVNRGLTPKFVVCSPALRSIQTGDELAKFLHAKLVIEPGLVEPLSWYRNPSKDTLDFRIDELSKYYMINNEDYSQIISMESITRLYATESETQGLSRIDFVLRSLAGEQRKNPLVVVGHAVTLAAAVALASQITSLEWQMGEQVSDENTVDQVDLGLRFPPGSVIAITQANKGPPFRYELTPNIVPPLSYGEIYTSQPVLQT